MTKGDDKKIVTAANRATALTALAAKGQKSAGDCLSSDVMAAVVAGNLSAGERQHCLDHLAHCQACYDEWRALASDEGVEYAKIIKGSWFSKPSFSFTAAGSLLAAAASLILYLNLTPPSVMESQAPVPQVMMESDSPAEVVSDDRQPLKEEVASPPPLQKALRPEPRRMASQEAKRKEFMLDADIDTKASVNRSKKASRPMRTGDNFEEEQTVEADLAALFEESEDMVDIGNVIPVVLKKMAQLGEGESLVLLTFKRDRSLTLIRLADERVLIKEEGFVRGEFEVAGQDLKKALKPLLEKEFPRSTKVRILSGGRSAQ